MCRNKMRGNRLFSLATIRTSRMPDQQVGVLIRDANTGHLSTSRILPQSVRPNTKTSTPTA
jgi:hypothetical protein